jgi:hypothetical protein
MSRHADALHATISEAFHMHDEGNKGLSINFNIHGDLVHCLNSNVSSGARSFSVQVSSIEPTLNAHSSF